MTDIAERQHLLPKSSKINDNNNNFPNTATDNHLTAPNPSKNIILVDPYTITDFFKELSIGSVNTLICIPVLFGFTTIVYSHPFFEEIRPVLVKLLLWSSILHQISMTLFSSMNFSVCQVQDAGLLFLGAMVTKLTDSIITTCGHQHASAAASTAASSSSPTSTNLISIPFEAYSYECTSGVISTTLFTISLATGLLGLALMIISYKRLASLVNYLPLSVISAYLAYIGALLFTAAISITTGISLGVPHDVFAFFYNNLWYLTAMIPSWLLALGIMLVQRRYPSPLTLPFALLSIPIVFYTISFILGYNLEDLRLLDLVEQPHTQSHSITNFLSPKHIHFTLIPSVAIEWGLMVFVVAFSSALDIISIELELGKPLDINHELFSVGIANFVNGCFAGATGSYIFSQTIFTAKSKPKSRLPGATLAGLEAIVLFCNVDLTAFLPKLWFATTLNYIAFELMYEWIIQRRKKVQFDDYCITVVTFIAILFISLQSGLFLGILCALIHFIYIYSESFSIQISTFYTESIDNIPSIIRGIIYSPQSTPNLHQRHSSSNHLLSDFNINNNINILQNNLNENNTNPLVPNTFPNATILRTNAITNNQSLLPGYDGDRDNNYGVNKKQHDNDDQLDERIQFQQLSMKINTYLHKNVVIFELFGHIRFMTAPRVLVAIKEAIISYQASQLMDYLLAFYHNHPDLIPRGSNTSQNNTSDDFDSISDTIGANAQNQSRIDELELLTSRDSVGVSSGEMFWTPNPSNTTPLSLHRSLSPANIMNRPRSPLMQLRKQLGQQQQYNTFEADPLRRANSIHTTSPSASQDQQQQQQQYQQNSANFPHLFAGSPTTSPDCIDDNNTQQPHQHQTQSPPPQPILSPYLNPSFILDFTNVVGVDSSAIHNTKLILNFCNQLQQQQPHIFELYTFLKNTYPSFPYPLPLHISDSKNNPPVPLYQYGSGNGQADATDPVYYPTFTTSFDLLLTSVSTELLTLFMNNGIPIFDTTMAIDNESNRKNDDDDRDHIANFSDQIQNTTFTPSSAHPTTQLNHVYSSSLSTSSIVTTTSSIAVLQESALCQSISTLAGQVDQSSDRPNLYQSGPSSSFLPSSPSSNYQLSRNVACHQLLVATLFNLDPHSSPSFISPFHYQQLESTPGNNDGLNGQNQPNKHSPQCRLDSNSNDTNPSPQSNLNSVGNGSSAPTIPFSPPIGFSMDDNTPINRNDSNGSPSSRNKTPGNNSKASIVFAHFEDIPAAKTWVAAKAYLLYGFKV